MNVRCVIFICINKYMIVQTIAMENRCCVLGCVKTSDDGVKLHEYVFLLIVGFLIIIIIETLLCIIL